MDRLAAVLVFLGLLIAVGCGEPGLGIIGVENSAGEYAAVTVEQQVILERSGLTVTARSLIPSGTWGPRLKIHVENGRNSPVILLVCDLAINGVVVDDIFYCEAAPGEGINDEIIFMSSDLEAAGIKVIKKIEFRFRVCETDTWNTLFYSEPIVLTTSADPSFEQAYDDKGYPAFAQDGFRAVISRRNSEESPWGTDIFVYMENNSDTDAVFQIKEILVNGSMVQPIFYAEVPAGKIAYDKIAFLESDLADNYIENIVELRLKFQIIDRDSGDTILETEEATVIFTERSLSERGIPVRPLSP